MGAKLIDFIKVDQLQNNNINTLFKVPQPNFVYTELRNIREASQKFKMLLIPLEYFDMNNALKDEMFINDTDENKKAVKKSIKDFIAYFKDKADIYLLCPPQFYAIKLHIDSNIDKSIYSCGDSTLITIQAMMPFLRETHAQLKNLDKRVSNVEESIKKQQESLIKGFSSNKNIILDDPMLFAIPKGQDVYADTQAIIGACWGKDITPELIQSIGMKNLNNNINLNSIEYIIESNSHEKQRIFIENQYMQVKTINDRIAKEIFVAERVLSRLGYKKFNGMWHDKWGDLC